MGTTRTTNDTQRATGGSRNTQQGPSEPPGRVQPGRTRIHAQHHDAKLGNPAIKLNNEVDIAPIPGTRSRATSDTNDNQLQGSPTADANGNGATNTSPAPRPGTDTSSPPATPFEHGCPASTPTRARVDTTLGNPAGNQTTAAGQAPITGPPNQVPGTADPAKTDNAAANDNQETPASILCHPNAAKRQSQHHVSWASPLTRQHFVDADVVRPDNCEPTTPHPRAQTRKLHPL